MTVRILPAAERAAVPWRNGGGVTREVAAEPTGAAEFTWRVSVAEVAADGPFSAYPGYHRVLTVVGGAGLELTVDGTAHEARPHEPFAFPGGAQTTCRLLGEPVTDLNVISRGRPRVEVHALEAGEDVHIAVGAGLVVAVVLAGEARLAHGASGRATLGPLDAVRLDAGAEATITTYNWETTLAVIHPAGGGA
jgi:uncharacterized protein